MENKFKKQIAIYALYNKETNKYDNFIYSTNDEEAKNYFLDNIATLGIELSKEGNINQYKKLLEELKTNCLMKMAVFNEETGEFINEKINLLDAMFPEVVEQFIKEKLELQKKFVDLVPNKKKKGKEK